MSYLVELIQHTHETVQTASDVVTHTSVLASTATPHASDAASSAQSQAARAGCYIGAGLAMTGALGVGFGQGYVGGKAALAVAKNPDEYSKIRAMMLVGAAIAESSAIYALIIAILLIFVAPSLS